MDWKLTEADGARNVDVKMYNKAGAIYYTLRWPNPPTRPRRRRRGQVGR